MFRARSYFYVYVKDSEIIGYVNSTRTFQRFYDFNLLSSHCDEGDSLCIHSVVIKDSFQGKGFARKMLKKYLDSIKEKIKRFILIAKDELVKFYSSFGFVKTRKVTHVWNEMILEY